MNIIDIAREIEAKENKPSTTAERIEWKPIECTEYTLPVFHIPPSRSKANIKKNLGKVLAFIDMVKHQRLAHGCTIMPIASTNKKFKSICGSQQNASNLIQYMIAVGLISLEDDNYQFNATQEEYNKSKLYRYYYDNEQEVIKYCEENDINKYVVRNNKTIHMYTVVQSFKIETFEEDQAKFSSHLHLLKPDNYSVAQFENYIESILYKNYPLLAHYQELADNINDTYYAEYPELAIRFVPHFTWSKGNKAITKIGIRATNTLVSAKKDKDDKDNNFHGFYKEDILEKYGFNLDKDVTSSVPRIALSMNVGEWIPEEIDIYEMIYYEYVRNHTNDTIVQSFEEVRPAIKKLHMRGYFDRPNMLGVHTRRAMKTVEDKAAVDNEMKIYQNAIIAAEGGVLYGNEIFFHESCIYMDVLYQLLKEGFFVWQCYDAWYAKKDGISQEQFEEYVREITEQKANKYIDTVVQSFRTAC